MPMFQHGSSQREKLLSLMRVRCYRNAAMIKEVDEDLDQQISYREFLLIFRYAKTGRLSSEGLRSIASSVNVTEVHCARAAGSSGRRSDQLNNRLALGALRDSLNKRRHL